MYCSNIREVNRVYDILYDNLSKNIFMYRFLYSTTNDKKYLRDMIYMLPQGRCLEKLKDCAELYVFGCGNYGKWILDLFDLPIKAFTDNDNSLWGGTVKGIPIVSPEKLSTVSTVIIANRKHHLQILQQLLNMNFQKRNIVDLGQIVDDLVERQYFDLPYLPHSPHEIFIDAGGYDGDTSLNFIKWANGNYDKIYIFEPDKGNIRKCVENLSKVKDFEIIQKGVWCKSGVLSFSSDGSALSSVNINGIDQIEVESFDNSIKEPVTFVKMDIEGSELEALKGCKNIIKTYKPKLAISIYHKPEDIWSIPQYIISLHPEYKFYLRHYSIFNFDTVLYAV